MAHFSYTITAETDGVLAKVANRRNAVICAAMLSVRCENQRVTVTIGERIEKQFINGEVASA